MQRDLEALSPERGDFIKSLLSGIKELCRRGERKRGKVGRHQGIKVSKQSRSNKHGDSQRLWQYAQVLHGPVQGEVPVPKEKEK